MEAKVMEIQTFDNGFDALADTSVEAANQGTLGAAIGSQGAGTFLESIAGGWG
jgi:ABC-type uncharacterized transport system ATPase subunit